MDKLFRWTLLLVVLVIFASGAVAVYTVFFSGVDDVTVPHLSDMPADEAVAALERLGLAANVVRVPSSLPQGRVLTQSPEAGVRLRREGGVVILQISQGGPRRGVPDVRNLDLARAQDAIRNQGFRIGDIVRIRDDSQPVGTVIAQSPAAPANIPADSRIDLLVNAGGEGRVVIPDVARMSERQAREILAANSLKVARVDPVYSPNEPEGSVAGTRPAAGTTVRAGESVLLRVVTAKRPETPGTPKSVAGSSGDAPSSAPSSQVVVKIPGYDDVVVAESRSPSTSSRASGNADTGKPVVQVIQNPALSGEKTLPSGGGTTTSAPGTGTAPAKEPETPPTPPKVPANLQPAGGKIARIRYQVPPLARPLQLKIEMVDPAGTKVLLNREAKSGEYVSLDAPYSKECAVTIYLGGEFVWQDRYM
ncbi:MAG: PASTA domain-containing protein [Synergistaceae bacterium]|jgi:serine/threonine-protein kinase|nr:PASTA domain-containing protein [Synergistaceae bacterium]